MHLGLGLTIGNAALTGGLPPAWAASTAYVVGDRLSYRTQASIYIFSVATAHTSAANPLTDITAGRLTVVSRQNRTGTYAYPAAWILDTIPVTFNGAGSVTTPYDSDAAFRDAFSVHVGDPGTVGTATYYVSPTGNDGWAGTEAAPLKTVGGALVKADVLTIYVLAVTGSPVSWGSQNVGKSVNVIGYGDGNSGRVFLYSPGVSPAPFVFVKTGGYTNVYECTSVIAWEKPSNPTIIDSHGLPTGLTQVSSIADVDAGVSGLTYYINTATKTLYVNYPALPVAGVDIFATHQTWKNSTFISANDNTNKKLYLENVVFCNGVTTYSNQSCHLNALNCGFVGGQLDSTCPFTCNGPNTILKKCISAYSTSDGFQYQSSAARSNIELDCVSYTCGTDDGGSDQCSTNHLAGHSLRIRSTYGSAFKNAVLDVGSGITINIACVFGDASRTALDVVGVANTRPAYHILNTTTNGTRDYLNNSSVPTKMDGDFWTAIMSGTGTFVLDDAV